MADHYGLIDKGFYCCDGLGFLVFAQLTLRTSAENLLHQISRKQISVFIYYCYCFLCLSHQSQVFVPQQMEKYSKVIIFLF